MIALRAMAPLHHPLNRYAATGGALRRFLVDWAASCQVFLGRLAIVVRKGRLELRGVQE